MCLLNLKWLHIAPLALLIAIIYLFHTAATTMATVQRADVQQATQYSCANPVMEIIERIIRIVFIVSNKYILCIIIIS